MTTDVTDATFQTEVLDRSQTTPVVVDLWAPWCGPCHQLGPIIEKVVDETAGKVVLAKVNVDENPQVSAAFRVQGIPAVYAVSGGKGVGGFIGGRGGGEEQGARRGGAFAAAGAGAPARSGRRHRGARRAAGRSPGRRRHRR